MSEMDLHTPDPFEEYLAKKWSDIVNLLMLLNGLDVDEAFSTLVNSTYAMQSRIPESEMWYAPPYHAYRWVCEEHGLEAGAARWWYDNSKLPRLEAIALAMLKLCSESGKREVFFDTVFRHLGAYRLFLEGESTDDEETRRYLSFMNDCLQAVEAEWARHEAERQAWAKE